MNRNVCYDKTTQLFYEDQHFQQHGLYNTCFLIIGNSLIPQNHRLISVPSRAVLHLPVSKQQNVTHAVTPMLQVHKKTLLFSVTSHTSGKSISSRTFFHFLLLLPKTWQYEVSWLKRQHCVQLHIICIIWIIGLLISIDWVWDVKQGNSKCT